MRIGNRSRTCTECFPEIEKIKEKKFKRATHRRVHSLPISFMYKQSVVETIELEKSIYVEMDKMKYFDKNENEVILEDETNIKSEPDIMRLIAQRDWESIEICCEDLPEKAEKGIELLIHGEKHRCLPLHAVCIFKPPRTTVDALVNVNRDAVTRKGHLDLLPIHIACRHGASIDIVRILAEAYPPGLNSIDSYGNLPIHYACAFSPKEVIKFLLNSSPETSKVLNRGKQLPIHLLCSRSDLTSITSIIFSMYARHPYSLCEKDAKGFLPLHSAISHQVPLDMIEIVLSLYPQGLFTRDNFGRTPLDISKKLRRSAHAKLIFQLLQSTWRKAGTPFTRTLNLISSRYKATSSKLFNRDSEKNLMIRGKFFTVHPRKRFDFS